MYCPTMASLIAKRKKHKLYYYVVDSARVQGRPRIVHQTYLGSAEKVAALLKERTAPLPLSASRRELGLPGALWLAAQQSGVFALLQSLWGQPRSGPSPAHYLLLAAMHRICSPGPKTAVADWYQQTILSPLWGFEPERFSSQAFWDCFEQLLPEKASRGAKRRTRSAGRSASPPARPVEGKAARQPPLAGLRHHQLSHLHCHHQHPQYGGAARP